MGDAANDQTALIWIAGGVTLAVFFWMVSPALDGRKWRMAADLSGRSLLWAALSIGLLALLVDLVYVPMILVAIIVHEYGHVLAYRLAGHKRPLFRIVPLGGVAMSDQQHQNQAEVAYVALMGPGFSLVLMVAALLAHVALSSQPGLSSEYATLALELAGVVGVLNALNLIPVLPFDGGAAVRATATVGGPSVARAVSLLACGVFGFFAFMMQHFILLFITLFGVLAAIQADKRDLAVAPMRGGQAVVATLAYGAVFVAHLWIGLPFLAKVALETAPPPPAVEEPASSLEQHS